MTGLEEKVAQLARLLQRASYALALTGAGVSTDSGIPDFRSPGGLWERYDPVALASREGFLRDPQRFYDFWRERFAMLTTAKPNITHRVLAQLERRDLLQGVITQNIDGLHRAAGSQRVWEVHGSYREGVCIQCGHRLPIEELFALAEREADRVPRCPRCRGLLKPDVVLFGEPLPPTFLEAQREVERADLLMVLGSSLEVYPVAGLVPQAAAKGAEVVIINRDPTAFDHLAGLLIQSPLAPVMALLQRLLDLEEADR